MPKIDGVGTFSQPLQRCLIQNTAKDSTIESGEIDDERKTA
jgi:hypothetical protein